MILTETLYRDDNAELVRTYSNLGVKLRQIETGRLYDETIDVVPCRYTYEESDVPIGDSEDNDPEAILAILMGGAV